MDCEDSTDSSITHEQSVMKILNPPIKIFKLNQRPGGKNFKYVRFSLKDFNLVLLPRNNSLCLCTPALTLVNLQVCNEKDKIAIFCNLSRDRDLAGGLSRAEMKVTQTYCWFWTLSEGRKGSPTWSMKLITAGWQSPDVTALLLTHVTQSRFCGVSKKGQRWSGVKWGLFIRVIMRYLKRILLSIRSDQMTLWCVLAGHTI